MVLTHRKHFRIPRSIHFALLGIRTNVGLCDSGLDVFRRDKERCVSSPAEDFDVETSATVCSIVVEGTIVQENSGHVVLDDFSMTPTCETSANQKLPGEDQLTTPSPLCPSGQLQCDNGNCYNPIESCNFMNDCGDGTDEKLCSKSCDFEEGDLCGWYESSGSSSHWAISGFPAADPGPESDHSYSTNTHDLSTAKDQGAGGQVAILETYTFSTVGAHCTLSFWTYVGYEEDPPTLVLTRKTEEDAASGKPAETLWSATSSGSWIKENIKISGKRDFTLHFMATHSRGKTYVAVDDLQFRLCEPGDECQASTDFQCADGHCIPRQYYCDAKYDCVDKSDEYQCPAIKGNCNFDSATWTEECSYKQRSDDDLEWQWASSSGQPATGPQHDHTLGSNGHYVYVSSSEGQPGLLATLQTLDEYPPSQGICYLRLWHYMHTDLSAENVDIGALRVYLADKFNRRYLVASVSGNNGEEWEELVILVNMELDYFVLLEAETGTSKYTYIAVDDVSLTEECETGVGPPPANSTCDTDQRACESGECVGEAFFCDCFTDCIDGSDEWDCGSTCTTLATRTSTSTTSTITTTTTQNPDTCSKTEFPCGDSEHTCIPGLLLCDTVPDCPNDADESQCPDNAQCDVGFFYCGDPFMSGHPCMRVDYECDGITECSTYSADESLCGSCPDSYCQNGGLCATDGKGERPTWSFSLLSKWIWSSIFKIL